MKKWADWMRSAQKKHDYMSFRQDLKGYGEPADGCWDGYQRINTDTKSGGILGIFRQGSVESQRIAVVRYLDPKAIYEIIKAPTGEVLHEMSGKDLAEKGFRVSLEKEFDAAVFEILKR